MTSNIAPHLWAPQARASQWLGTAGATEAALQATETRLQTTLPPSYRAFLTATNGWSALTRFVWRVYPVEEIGWYGPRYPNNLALLRGDFGTGPLGKLGKLLGWPTTSPANDDGDAIRSTSYSLPLKLPGATIPMRLNMCSIRMYKRMTANGKPGSFAGGNRLSWSAMDRFGR